MSSSIVSPFPFFTDTTGAPLEGGYLYLGQSNLNPETAPVNVFWDAALTIPAGQPVRTVGGYPSRAGTASRLYVATDTYSITVRNKNRALVFSAFDQSDAPSSVFDISTQLITATASQVTFALTAFSYLPGTDTLEIYRNGLRLNLGLDYLETNSSTVTLTAPAAAGDQFLFQGGGVITSNQVPGSQVSFIQVGTGAVTRNIQDKAREMVSVKDFGAVGDGVVDDTVAFQTAFNSGAKLVFIPATSASYLVGALTMPTTTGFVLQGSGPAAALKQKAGAGCVLSWPTRATDLWYPVQLIENVHFDGKLGTDHIVNTSYVGNVEFFNCSVRNIPTNKSAFYVNGNPTDGTYTHDIYFNSCEIINNTSSPGSGSYGIAGIQLGPKAADIEINEFIFNGNFITQNAIAIESGCGSVHIEGGHIFNSISPLVSIVSPADVVRINGCGIDNSQSDLLRAENAAGLSFQNCRFQAVQSGRNAVTLVDCSNTNIGNCNFDSVSNAFSAVRELGTCFFTIVSYPIFINISSFNDVFILTGDNSFVRGAYRENLKGYLLPFAFCSTTTTAPNSTAYLGINGLQANASINTITSPIDGIVNSCTVIVNNAPGAGQSHTIELYKNNVLLTSGTISGASQFIVNLAMPPSPTSDIAGGVGFLHIKVISSLTAAATVMRGCLTISA